MLTKGVVRRIDLPHEPGEWIDARALGYWVLESAKQRRLMEHIRVYRELGPSAPAVTSDGRERPDGEAPAVPVDPLTQYDLTMLLEEGIVDWSYPEKVSREAIRSLDLVTAELIGRALVPGAETEEARKNG